MILTYGLGLIGALFMLILWFRFRSQAQATSYRNLFFLCLLVFLGSLLGQPAPVAFKFQVLLRDLLFVGVLGTAFSYIAQLRTFFWIGFVLTIMGGFFYFKNVLQPTFPYQNQMKEISLDPSGEWIMEVAQGTDIDKLRADFARYDIAMERAFFPARPEATDLDDYYMVNIPDGAQQDRLKKKLLRKKEIEHLEDNEVVEASPLSSTKLSAPIKQRYGLDDPGLEHLWGFDRMKMDQLYSLLHGVSPKRKALVAILDTGVDSEHEDLQANYRSIKSSYDNDPRGHGTHCAGIAGAVSNNGVGVASYSQSNSFVEVTSIKVLNPYGMGNQRTIIKGILEAVDKGADVISLSLGGPSTDSRQKAYSEAVAYAKKAGVIVVAAAGNSNLNAKDYSPANADGLITVSAVDDKLHKAVFSNTVQDVTMGLAAPGVGIYSTIPGSKYDTYNGTSMATPYVSGLIGLMKSLKPDLTTEEAYTMLKKSGQKTDQTRLTGKFIQPARAVKEILNQ
ncbi:MAG: S8 family serine peptidase [Saprospiraceae bacterium]|nr:S8 family serine peptidase [Saprospiraceae bacterium]